MKFVVGLTIIAILGLGIVKVKDSQSKNFIEQIEQPIYVKAIYSMPVSYDPIKMNDGASLIFSELVYEGLLRFTDDYGVQAGIANSWSTSKDGLKLTFKLDPNAKFHNGETVTANDVVASLTRNVSKESVVFKFYDVIKGAKKYHQGLSTTVEGFKAIDEHTIEIQLEKPFPPILYVLAGGTAKILPAMDLENKDFFKKPVGSGPFKIISIDDNSIHLARHSQYHGEMPKISEMQLVSIDQENAMGKAMTGEIHDLSSWPMNGSEEVFKIGKDINSVVADTWIIGLNTRIKPFNDLEVRKLFEKSISKDKFRKIFYPDAKPAFGYIPPSFPGHKKSSIIKELSRSIPPKDQITISIPAELARSNEMAKFFEDELSSKGWNIKVNAINWDKMMSDYSQKKLQAFLVSMIVDYPDSEFLLNNFESTNPDNFSGLNNPIIDQLIVKSRETKDRIERQKIQKRLADLIDEQTLSVNLFHSRAHYWVHRCVDGFKPNLLAVAYTDYRKVSFNSECLKGGSEWITKTAKR
ncbi:MAG: hypothetical protein COT74_10600 [Bdellovibrionales bacterium CG10_big_fil_rev_8_21_14_0_10_45_34]|nr:MAG: hypothetical protein COT74_10600 [Bdellovibrionales bacterium CG10_big_fil_rev_8_21_14_0_10_45_34]